MSLDLARGRDSLVLTKRSAASGDENGVIKDDFQSVLRSLGTLMFINIINGSLSMACAGIDVIG